MNVLTEEEMGDLFLSLQGYKMGPVQITSKHYLAKWFDLCLPRQSIDNEKRRKIKGYFLRHAHADDFELTFERRRYKTIINTNWLAGQGFQYDSNDTLYENEKECFRYCTLEEALQCSTLERILQQRDKQELLDSLVRYLHCQILGLHKYKVFRGSKWNSFVRRI